MCKVQEGKEGGRDGGGRRSRKGGMLILAIYFYFILRGGRGGGGGSLNDCRARNSRNSPRLHVCVSKCDVTVIVSETLK